jgi:hypothetical protein
MRYLLDGKTTWQAHRLVWRLLVGEVPEQLHHTCRNRPCCNPAHLIATTATNHGPDHHRSSTCHAGHDMTDPANVYIRKAAKSGKPQPACRRCRTERERARRESLGPRQRAQENAARTARRRRQRASG